MRLPIFLLLICVPFSVLALSPAQDLQSRLLTVKTMQANFQQTIVNSQGTVLSSSKGRMAIQKPGKFRWQTLSPAKQLVIANGETLWNYDDALEQVTVQRSAKGIGDRPAMLLSGETHLISKDYAIGRKKLANDLVGFLLYPKDKNSMFTRIDIYFRGQRLEQMKFIDTFGQTTHVSFTDLKINKPLSPNLFEFTPPKGVDVIKSS